MKQSESINKLLENFVKAQSEFPTLPKDKNGYNYKYTDLDTVISTIRPILAKNNIGFMQSLTSLESGRWGITTRIFNNAGEWMEDTTPLPEVSLAKGNAAQNVGAAITYMKRYALCAILGISSDEDTDAETSQQGESERHNQPPQNKKPQAPQKGPAGGPDTPEQKKKINDILAKTFPDGSKIFSKADCQGIGNLRMTRTANEVIKMLEDEAATRLKAKAAAQPKVPQQAPAPQPATGEPFNEDIPWDEPAKDPVF